MQESGQPTDRREEGGKAILALAILIQCRQDRFVLSIFIGNVAALGLIMLELRKAPIGYESEDGFHIIG